ncbi:MAG: PcfK-like family protein [Blastocatellia bacterium]|nr:PcfK-like family protein [Blastocatellia bacterium]
MDWDIRHDAGADDTGCEWCRFLLPVSFAFLSSKGIYLPVQKMPRRAEADEEEPDGYLTVACELDGRDVELVAGVRGRRGGWILRKPAHLDTGRKLASLFHTLAGEESGRIRRRLDEARDQMWESRFEPHAYPAPEPVVQEPVVALPALPPVEPEPSHGFALTSTGTQPNTEKPTEVKPKPTPRKKRTNEGNNGQMNLFDF